MYVYIVYICMQLGLYKYMIKTNDKKSMDVQMSVHHAEVVL